MNNLIKDLKDVFELANNGKKFISEVFELCKKDEKNSGDDGQMANSGDDGQMANSGNYGQMANSGDDGQMANSGNNGQMANSGYNVKMANSGNNVKMANSGDDGQMANSGNYGQMANSGNYGQMANSGNNVKMANSGYNGQMESTGKKSILANIGYLGIAKAKIGSWITLAEYRKNKNDIYEVYFVKTEYVDGKNIKEDVCYCLYDKQFREVIEIDGIKSAILNKKNNIYKVWNLGGDKTSYIVFENDIYSHGKTIKEARESFVYKISNRDTSQYNDLKLDTVLSFNEAIVAYRVITGACEYGVKMFVVNLKVKKKYTVKEIIELTKNQYGNDTFSNFIKNKGVNSEV
jgi:hypothetical protein